MQQMRCVISASAGWELVTPYLSMTQLRDFQNCNQEASHTAASPRGSASGSSPAEGTSLWSGSEDFGFLLAVYHSPFTSPTVLYDCLLL